MSARNDQQLYIVEADYRCRPEPGVSLPAGALVSHSGCSYASPPQPAVQALALVRILLQALGAQEPARGQGCAWQRAAAGGTLTIHLHLASADRQLQL